MGSLDSSTVDFGTVVSSFFNWTKTSAAFGSAGAGVDSSFFDGVWTSAFSWGFATFSSSLALVEASADPDSLASVRCTGVLTLHSAVNGSFPSLTSMPPN